jgi:hypothetical protein
VYVIQQVVTSLWWLLVKENVEVGHLFLEGLIVSFDKGGMSLLWWNHPHLLGCLGGHQNIHLQQFQQVLMSKVFEVHIELLS